MTLLSVIGIILIAIGVLAILSVIDISLTVGIVLTVAGLIILILDNRGSFIRRP